MSGSTFLTVYNLANLTAPASGVTHGGKWEVGLIGGQTANLNMLSQQEFLGPFLGQAMQVDNTGNATDLIITEQTYGWTRTVPAGGLQTFQYPAVEFQNFFFTSSGNIQAIISIFDWPAFPDDAGSVGAASVVTISGTVDVAVTGQPISVTGTVDVASTPGVPVAGLATEIVTGGTPVAVFVNTTHDGAFITNPNAASESIFVDAVNNADTIAPGVNGTTIELVAGQSQEFPALTGTVTANAVTNGHTFTAVGFG